MLDVPGALQFFLREVLERRRFGLGDQGALFDQLRELPVEVLNFRACFENALFQSLVDRTAFLVDHVQEGIGVGTLEGLPESFCLGGLQCFGWSAKLIQAELTSGLPYPAAGLCVLFERENPSLVLGCGDRVPGPIKSTGAASGFGERVDFC